MKGKAFEYQVGEYHLRVTFEEEDRIHWEYLAAPDGLTGKNSTEAVERSAVRDNVILLRWKEADGTQVVDVLDLGRMVIFTNFVLANGERYSSEADVVMVA